MVIAVTPPCHHDRQRLAGQPQALDTSSWVLRPCPQAGWHDQLGAGAREATEARWNVPLYDDVINVAGHRLSAGEMEEVLASHPDVAECAVIGVHDALKGQLPRGLVVLKAGASIEPDVLRWN